jgi:hypothetical protein
MQGLILLALAALTPSTTPAASEQCAATPFTLKKAAPPAQKAPPAVKMASAEPVKAPLPAPKPKPHLKPDFSCKSPK